MIEHKMHILLTFLLTQYISGTQKILNKENIGKLGQISSNLGNLLPILKKNRKIRKCRTVGRPVPIHFFHLLSWQGTLVFPRTSISL